VLTPDAGELVLTAEGAFLLEGVLTWVPFETEVLIDLETDYGRSSVSVSTGTQFGPCKVQWEVVKVAPTIDASWEDVVETSIDTTTGIAVSELVEGHVATITETPGTYRLRISATGRTQSAAAGEQYGRRSREHYLIQLWPSPMAESVVVRLTSDFARQVVDPVPEPPPLPEYLAGIQAARAIGRDIDGSPRSRSLTGEVGEVRISRTIPGTRRRVFKYSAWGPYWTTTGYMVSGAGGDPAVGRTFYLMSHESSGGEEPDHFTGADASIRQTWLELEPPRLQRKQFNWVRRDGGDLNWEDGVPIVPPDTPILARETVLTLEFSERKVALSGEQTGTRAAKETTIAVHHADVPLEWVEDLTAYWTWALAVMEQREFGLP
jgi:hypothetical protein